MTRSWRPSLIRAWAAGLGALFSFGSLQASGEVSDAELRIQAQHIASLQEMVLSLHERQRITEQRVEKLEALRAEIGKLNEQLRLLRSQITSLQSDIENLAQEFVGYRSDYRKWVRIDGVGEEIPVLVTAGGKTYENVKVRRVTNTGLDIRHEGGSTRLLHTQLPGEIRDRFQWDGETAALALAQEARDEALRERLHAITVRQEEQKQAEVAKATATEQRIRDLENQLAAVKASTFTSRLGSSGALGERRQVGRSTSRYIYGARPRTSVYYYPTGSYFPAPQRISRPVPRGAVIRMPAAPRREIRPPMRLTNPTRMCPGGRD